MRRSRRPRTTFDPGDPARGAADGCRRSGMRSWRGSRRSTRPSSLDLGRCREDARREPRVRRRRGDAREPRRRRAVSDDPVHVHAGHGGFGEWRPTNGVSDPFAWVAQVRPFTLRSTSQFRTAGPNPVPSTQYAKEYAEVKALGAATGSSRTPEQTALASFYIPNPVEIFNRTFRDDLDLDVARTSPTKRVSTRCSTSPALTRSINCWDDKEFWHFWRPVTAIQAGADDGNRRDRWGPGLGALHLDAPRTDPGSFLPTPPYPDQPSGYNCLTSSMMHTAKRFFGDQMTFTVERTPGGTARTYTRFTDVVKDTIDARIYLGIHFRTADVDGTRTTSARTWRTGWDRTSSSGPRRRHRRRRAALRAALRRSSRRRGPDPRNEVGNARI